MTWWHCHRFMVAPARAAARERKKRAAEALDCNALPHPWPQLVCLATARPPPPRKNRPEGRIIPTGRTYPWKFILDRRMNIPE